MILSQPPSRVDGGWATYAIDLQPRERWELVVDVVPSPSGEVVHPKTAERRFGEELQHVRDSLTAWQLRVPQLRADWDDLERSVSQSISDLAALRIRAKDNGRVAVGRLPAAGMPWFMTVFGRDSIVTGIQTMLLGPELARSVARGARGAAGDRRRPGARRGAGEDRARGSARQGFGVVVQALLRHGRRDAALSHPALGGLAVDRRHAARDEAARAGHAGARVDRPLRRSRRRRLRRVPEALVSAGSTTSRGRTRTTRSASRTAGWRSRRSRPVEVQGYVFDAKQRMAEIAREAWRDRELGDRLDREAKELRRRVQRRVLDRGARRLLRPRARRRQASRRFACARTWATCCGAGSSPPSGRTPSSTG